MFLLREPSENQIRSFLEGAQQLPLSYDEEGATRGTLPSGYRIDHNRIILGHGSEVFRQAQTALKEWKQFDLGWARIVPDRAPLITGSVVVVVVAHFPFWSMNACRIIYTIDEENSSGERFGFAYGTLIAHAERGEERFTIEWNTATDEVCFEIVAFSRPGHWLVRIGYPLARWWQKRFARESLRAMLNNS